MSNYTLAVNWSGKDSLSDSDSAKVISGIDFNTEFTTVQTAVNSKADLNGSSSEDFTINNATVSGNTTMAGTLAVTGNATVPTQSQSDNSTKAATTAYVDTAVAALDKAAINNLVYPVGSIFTTTSDSAASATTPAEVNTLLGMGTWEAFGKGRVLIGNGTSTDDDQPIPESQTFTAGTEGGEFKHTLTVDEMPSHTHKTWAKQESFDPIRTHAKQAYANTSIATNDPPLADTGGDDPHNNLQPYIVVYMWKRTA